MSDTTNPDIWVREEMAFAELREEVSHPQRLFYRNRRENVERKSGNIAEFCATWGERYRYMIVMDADSVMTGQSVVDLVRLMERNPHVCIVQTPPLPVNGRTGLSPDERALQGGARGQLGEGEQGRSLSSGSRAETKERAR